MAHEAAPDRVQLLEKPWTGTVVQSQVGLAFLVETGMKLIDLNPERIADGLYFDCPKCGDAHRLGVNGGWGDLSQPLETMTLQHSVQVMGDTSCQAHFTVNNGEVTIV